MPKEAYDYSDYCLTLKEKFMVVVLGLLISAALSWLFYKHILGMLMSLYVIPRVWKNRKKTRAEEIRKELCFGFKDTLQSVSSAMQAGYSIENAWREAQKDMERLHGETNPMTWELRQINAKIRLNLPLEQLLTEFATRSACEEILSFCQVFQFAKRSGGDFIKVMRVTANHIQSKVEMQQEIDTLLSAQRMEQKVMNIMPLGILAFINLSGAGFLDAMYGNVSVILIMSVALAVYVFSIWLSEKIGAVTC